MLLSTVFLISILGPKTINGASGLAALLMPAVLVSGSIATRYFRKGSFFPNKFEKNYLEKSANRWDTPQCKTAMGDVAAIWVETKTDLCNKNP